MIDSFGRFFCKALTTVRPPKPESESESKTAIGCGEAIVNFLRDIVRENNETLRLLYKSNRRFFDDILNFVDFFSSFVLVKNPASINMFGILAPINT